MAQLAACVVQQQSFCTPEEDECTTEYTSRCTLSDLPARSRRFIPKAMPKFGKLGHHLDQTDACLRTQYTPTLNTWGSRWSTVALVSSTLG